MRREWNNIDILISSESQRFVCAIENKVQASEHNNQLRRYLDACEAEFPDYRHHFVFLTPRGNEPSHPAWVPAGYDAVLTPVERVIAAEQSALTDEVRLFLRHYAGMLRRHIVGESEIEEVCARIHNKHRRALELLLRHRPDTQSGIQAVLDDLLKSDEELELGYCTKAYIRFSPRSWTSPHLDTGTFGRILLFQFENRPESLALLLEIGPGNDDVRSRIWNAARNDTSGVFRVPRTLSPSWCRIFRLPFLSRQDYQGHPELIEAKIRDRMNAFKATQFPQIDEAIRGIDFEEQAAA